MKTKNLLAMFGASCFILTAGCKNENNKHNDGAQVSREEANKEKAKAIFAVFENGNTDALDTLIHENSVDHTPDPMMDSQGLKGVKNMVQMQRTAFPDMKTEILHIVADDEMVMVHFRSKGTNTGAMGNMPATNKEVDMTGVDIIKFTDGMATNHWGVYDNLKMMQQLGMIPMQDAHHADNMHAGADSVQMNK